MEKYEDWKGVPGMKLIGRNAVFPHMEEMWEPIVSEKKDYLEEDVWCIADTEICLVDGGNRSISKVICK
jgi:hypothetical protein